MDEKLATLTDDELSDDEISMKVFEPEPKVEEVPEEEDDEDDDIPQGMYGVSTLRKCKRIGDILYIGFERACSRTMEL